MQLLKNLVYFLAIACVAGQTFNPSSLTKYNVFVKTPVNTEQIQTGGRLIERHLAYLQQAGFKGVLSIVEFTTNDTSYNGVSGSFPSSTYEMSLVSSYGMVGNYLTSSLTVDSVKQVSAVIDSMPKPLYIHCHVGYSATLFTQLHLYLKGSLSSNDIYPSSLNIGYDYQANSDVVKLINSLTGRNDSVTSERIEKDLAAGESSYKSYYWTHRLGNTDGFYNVGEILDTHLQAIHDAGYKTILSYRDDKEATVRLPSDPPTGAIDNHEFSDENGNYRISIEENYIKQIPGLAFISLPLVSGGEFTWTLETFNAYKDTLKTAHSNGPVLVHCASGYRSSAFTLTYLAYQAKQCSDWVVLKGRQVGFDFHSANPSATDLEVQQFMYDVLGC